MKWRKVYSCVVLLWGGLSLLLVGGCGPALKENAMVTDAREVFASAYSDPDVSRNAPLEIEEAKKALENAEESLAEGADLAEVEHLAYLARQKAHIASQVAAMRLAEKEVEAASAERNKVLLAARTKEAATSLSEAERARREAEAQRRAAEQALQEAQLKAAEAEKARQEALAAEARAKKLEEEIADLQASKTERGLVVTLGDVLFDTAKTDLKPGAYSTIEKLAAFLAEYPARRVQIEGFTDSRGSEEYNLGLSIRRAEAVRNALLERGISPDRLLYRGYGEDFPVASNDTAAGRQRNRRVEIVISDETGFISERVR